MISLSQETHCSVSIILKRAIPKTVWFCLLNSLLDWLHTVPILMQTISLNYAGVTLSLMVEAHIQGQRASARCDWVASVYIAETPTDIMAGSEYRKKINKPKIENRFLSLCAKFNEDFKTVLGFFLASIVLTSILLKIRKKNPNFLDNYTEI